MHEARMQAYAVVFRAVQGEASTIAYIDTFWVLAVGASIMFCLSFLLKKNIPGGGDVAVGSTKSRKRVRSLSRVRFHADARIGTDGGDGRNTKCVRPGCRVSWQSSPWYAS
jgi:hypothetical protein